MKRICRMALMVVAAASAAQAKTIVVSPDGSGDVKTLQEAVAAVPENGSERTIVHLKAGTHQGPVAIPKNKPFVTVEGEGAERTFITYDKNVNESRPEGYDKFNPTMHVAANDFSAKDVTIQNTSGDHGQALALRIDGDRAAVQNCRLMGWQDTLMVNNGRQYFKGCWIEGRVDFIYGSGTAVFEACKIHSKNGGYITAASTPQEKPYGLVFMNCELTGDDQAWDPATTNPATTQKAKSTGKMAYLGRPWRDYGAVIFMNCVMGDHIRPEGWHNWGKPEKEKTARYAEYHNTGPGAATEHRVGWAKQLTQEEAEKVTVEAVLGGEDHWKPTGP